jgi:hypothetical protein
MVAFVVGEGFLSPLTGLVYCDCCGPMACADGLYSFAAPRLGMEGLLKTLKCRFLKPQS